MNYRLTTSEDNCSCMECGNELRGRTDKKFCNDRCKNRYYNRMNNSVRLHKNRTIRILTSNYELLNRLVKAGVRTMRLIELEELGFSPDFHTSHRKGASGHNECCCFDISYCQSSSKIFNMRRISDPPKKI